MKIKVHESAGEEREAWFSDCGLYRYLLRVQWGDRGSELVQFVLLNPSTADERADDPTLRRCKAYARRWGFGGVVVTNLLAYRATDPSELAATPVYAGDELCRPYTDNLHLVAAYGCRQVVCGWGTWASRWPVRAERLLDLLGDRARGLALTKGGHPAHPLYLRGDLVSKLFDSWRLEGYPAR